MNNMNIGSKDNRRTFRLSDDDMKKLELIAKNIFGDAKNNNTAALKYLINKEYQNIS
jgi:hypothetical protein